MSKRTKIIAAVVALAVIGGIAAYVAFGSGGAGPEVESATVTEQQLAVTVTASGKVEKGVSADVFAPAAGVLAEVKVSEGETVTAGQVLAQMDTGPLELQAAQARAGLSQAEAQLAAIDDQGASAADISAARAGVAAAQQAYEAALAAEASIGDQAPSQAQIDAAAAATKAAKTAYDNAVAFYNAAVAASPNPSVDPTVAVAAAQRDQAYAGYLGAKAQEEALRNTDLSAAALQAQAGVDQAYAGLKSAQAQLARLTSADTAAARRAAEAGVKSAAEAVALAEKNLEDATLVAPIDGVVVVDSGGGAAAAAAAAAAGGGAGGGGASAGLPKEGSAVSPGAPVFTVVDLDALKFSAEVDEADINRIAVGMPAEVSLDAFPGEVLKTKVARINPAAQSTATGGTVFIVELPLDDTGREILLGMKGDVDVEVSSVGSALTIPVEALFSEGGTDYVYVIDGGVLSKTEITVGATTDTDVEVLEGLSAGDKVALSGSVQYTDGMAVQTEDK